MRKLEHCLNNTIEISAQERSYARHVLHLQQIAHAIDATQPPTPLYMSKQRKVSKDQRRDAFEQSNYLLSLIPSKDNQRPLPPHPRTYKPNKRLKKTRRRSDNRSSIRNEQADNDDSFFLTQTHLRDLQIDYDGQPSVSQTAPTSPIKRPVNSYDYTEPYKIPKTPSPVKERQVKQEIVLARAPKTETQEKITKKFNSRFYRPERIHPILSSDEEEEENLDQFHLKDGSPAKGKGDDLAFSVNGNNSIKRKKYNNMEEEEDTNFSSDEENQPFENQSGSDQDETKISKDFNDFEGQSAQYSPPKPLIYLNKQDRSPNEKSLNHVTTPLRKSQPLNHKNSLLPPYSPKQDATKKSASYKKRMSNLTPLKSPKGKKSPKSSKDANDSDSSVSDIFLPHQNGDEVEENDSTTQACKKNHNNQKKSDDQSSIGKMDRSSSPDSNQRGDHQNGQTEGTGVFNATMKAIGDALIDSNEQNINNPELGNLDTKEGNDGTSIGQGNPDPTSKISTDNINQSQTEYTEVSELVTVSEFSQGGSPIKTKKRVKKRVKKKKPQDLQNTDNSSSIFQVLDAKSQTPRPTPQIQLPPTNNIPPAPQTNRKPPQLPGFRPPLKKGDTLVMDQAQLKTLFLSSPEQKETDKIAKLKANETTKPPLPELKDEEDEALPIIPVSGMFELAQLDQTLKASSRSSSRFASETLTSTRNAEQDLFAEVRLL